MVPQCVHILDVAKVRPLQRAFFCWYTGIRMALRRSFGTRFGISTRVPDTLWAV